MTRIDFYILDSSDANQRNVFVCRLADKVWRMGHNIHIQATHLANAEELDRLLWSSKTDAFLPHAIVPSTKTTPIHIGYGEETGQHHDLLINLCEAVPLVFSRFDRVAEIVTQIPEQLASSRERFRFYRERGYQIESHKIAVKGNP